MAPPGDQAGDPPARVESSTGSDGASGHGHKRKTESCIDHRNARAIPVREDLMTLFRRDLCKSLIIAQFEYKTNALIISGHRASHRNQAAKAAGRPERDSTDLWFPFPKEEMPSELLWTFDERTIRGKLKELETGDLLSDGTPDPEGAPPVIETRRCPFDRRQVEYRLRVSPLQDLLDHLASGPRISGCLPTNFRKGRVKNSGCLPTNSEGEIVGDYPPNNGCFSEIAGCLPTNSAHAYNGGTDSSRAESEEEEKKASSSSSSLFTSEGSLVPADGILKSSSNDPSSSAPPAPPAAPASRPPAAPDHIRMESAKTSDRGFALPRYRRLEKVKILPDPSPVEMRARAAAAPAALDGLYADLMSHGVSGQQADDLVASYSEERIRRQIEDMHEKRRRYRGEPADWNSAPVLYASIVNNSPVEADRAAVRDEMRPRRLVSREPEELAARANAKLRAQAVERIKAERRDQVIHRLAIMDAQELEMRRQAAIMSAPNDSLVTLLDSPAEIVRQHAEKGLREMIMEPLLKELDEQLGSAEDAAAAELGLSDPVQLAYQLADARTMR